MNSTSPEVDRQGRSALHAAAFQGDAAEVRRLIAEGFSPDLADHQGFTPLHLAAQEWHEEAARALLDADANVDPKNNFGNTPLWVAVFSSKGRGEIITLLRERGADPLSQNIHGKTPLGLARTIANHDVRQFFSDMEAPE